MFVRERRGARGVLHERRDEHARRHRVHRAGADDLHERLGSPARSIQFSEMFGSTPELSRDASRAWTDAVFLLPL